MQNVLRSKFLVILMAIVLAITLVTPALAQRRGGFGGGGRSFGSFGGGRSSNSFGGGRSFGGFSSPRSSSGSFGSSRSTEPSSGFGSSRSSSPSSTGPRSTSSSFGRSGSFGSSGRINSTSFNSANAPSSFRGRSPNYSSTVFVGGTGYSGFGYGFLGGYSLGLLSNPWYGYMPFHPGFYVQSPVLYNGAYYGGGINWFKVFLGLLIIGGVIWVISRALRGGGGGNIRYTNYR